MSFFSSFLFSIVNLHSSLFSLIYTFIYNHIYIKQDKMLNNYFGNCLMLSIYQNIFKKAMIERIYWVVSFQTNVKKRFRGRKGQAWKILEDQPQKFIGWTRPLLTSTTFNPFTSGLVCIKCCGEGRRFHHSKYFENHKCYVNELLHC